MSRRGAQSCLTVVTEQQLFTCASMQAACRALPFRLLPFALPCTVGPGPSTTVAKGKVTYAWIGYETTCKATPANCNTHSTKCQWTPMQQCLSAETFQTDPGDLQYRSQCQPWHKSTTLLQPPAKSHLSGLTPRPPKSLS